LKVRSLFSAYRFLLLIALKFIFLKNNSTYLQVEFSLQ
jgi:hypothetical protein